MNSIGLGQVYKDKSSDVSRWLRLFFGLSLLPPNEVSDAFTDDIMPDAPASDAAMKFADYVLENYIAVDSKFPPILWAKPPDLLLSYANNGAESYHSHLNAEFYVKHPNIYVFVLKKIQQTAHVSMNSMSQQAGKS